MMSVYTFELEGYTERGLAMHPKLIDRASFIVGGGIFILALYLFYSDTNRFFGSVGAALLAAALGWMAYVLVRLIILAIKR